MHKKAIKTKKNPAAVKLGRLGGQAYARNLKKKSKEEQSAIGRKAINARWHKTTS